MQWPRPTTVLRSLWILGSDGAFWGSAFWGSVAPTTTRAATPDFRRGVATRVPLACPYTRDWARLVLQSEASVRSRCHRLGAVCEHERTLRSGLAHTHTHTAAAVSLARSRGTEIASDSNFGRFGLSACACVVHGSSPSSQSKMHVQHAKHTHSSAFGEPTTSTAESRACHVAQAAGLSTSTRACRNPRVWRSRKVMHADCQDAFGAEQRGDGLSGWGRLKDEWRGQRS